MATVAMGRPLLPYGKQTVDGEVIAAVSASRLLHDPQRQGPRPVGMAIDEAVAAAIEVGGRGLATFHRVSR